MDELVLTIIKTFFVVILVCLSSLLLIFFDKKSQVSLRYKVSNRGLVKLLVADLCKLIGKRESPPMHARKILYYVSPLLSLILVFLPSVWFSFCDPFFWGTAKIYPEIIRGDYAIFKIYAFLLCGFLGYITAGWACNNKFATLSTIRQSTYSISCDLIILLSILSVMFVYGGHKMDLILEAQEGLMFGWVPSYGLLKQPLAGIIFLFCLIGKVQLYPLGVTKKDSLHSGFLIEYSGFGYMTLVFSKYVYLVMWLIYFSYLFLGGYSVLPGLGFWLSKFPLTVSIVQVLSLFVKAILVGVVILYLKRFIIEFKVDQYINWCWKFVLPLGLLNLVVTLFYLWFV